MLCSECGNEFPDYLLKPLVKEAPENSCPICQLDFKQGHETYPIPYSNPVNVNAHRVARMIAERSGYTFPLKWKKRITDRRRKAA